MASISGDAAIFGIYSRGRCVSSGGATGLGAGRLRIDYTLPDTVGISVSRGDTSAVDVNSSKIILVRDPSMPTGYKILTGYPTK